MIISNILGGLGNQMFQYAAGRAMALRNNALFKLDISEFNAYSLHQGFELSSVFKCSIAIANKQEISSILGWLKFRLFRRKIFDFLWGSNLLLEPHFQYSDILEKKVDQAYLTGYWQSELYFKDFVESIRDDFTFKNPLTLENQKLVDRMNSSNSVSLHVRRGDYIHNPITMAIHGACSLEYYSMAIAEMEQALENPEFFIFSDDINWVKENLKISYPHTFINHNTGSDSYRDMQLMSLCKNNIIANSSFSWWGAWLNLNPEKIVIAPKQWFATEINTNDLIPMEWIRL
ncbi:alpha-1,2-fucosyltransferase [Polynucleobacter paneuropaeus]|nr:alpha-1,2-fucosyltransferase [Polynucleobacter paneuropaeus]